MKKYHFPLEMYRMHDPLDVVGKHINEMSIGFPYQHDKNDIEEPKRITLTYE
jgi:hypothetical protein